MITQPNVCTPPARLEKSHTCEGFSSGADELDEWLTKYAWQNQRANNATTFVTTAEERVVGYYALTVASVTRERAPDKLTKGAPSQIPCLLLARLAVDESMQGKGIGRGLLVDSFRRSAHLATEVGVRALLVHSRDELARDFYLSNADFLESPIDPLQLMLPMKWIIAKFSMTAQ